MNHDLATRPVPCTRHGHHDTDWEERVVVEEPLELLIDGAPISVLMRTPGADEDLVYGFLCTEGVIKNADEVARVSATNEYGENKIVAFLKDHVICNIQRLTRHVFSGSSCGLCGKATIESIMQQHDPIPENSILLEEAVLLNSLSQMEKVQQTFQKTGGLHAAALFDLKGTLIVIREDVGRHNAVDKVIGHAIRNHILLSETFLLVSGRLSFEILQKALAARIPCLAAVSAPSSLAIDFAKESGQTLIGFLRPPNWNLYHEGVMKITLKA
jgi:FdhD protein